MKKLLALLLATLLLASALTTTASAAVYGNGSRATAVRYLERNLSALGYFSGSPNTTYDSRTTSAVKAYQRDRGLGVDGLAGPETISTLEGEIAAFQTTLRDLGYNPGDIDGVAGSTTLSAVKAFQADRGLSRTGKLDDATVAALQSAAIGSPTHSSDAAYPTTAAEVKDMLILSTRTASPRRGKIVYISQFKNGTYTNLDYFRAVIGGRTYDIDPGNKCTRIAVSHALSYLGVEMTPGMQSELLGKTDIDSPIRDVPAAMTDTVKKYTTTGSAFEKYFDRYTEDDDYSPIIAYFKYSSTGYHAVTIVGYNGATDTYLAVDSGYGGIVVELKFNGSFSRITDSSIGKYIGATIEGFTQLKLK